LKASLHLTSLYGGRGVTCSFPCHQGRLCWMNIYWIN
jgi:hypothetical protein